MALVTHGLLVYVVYDGLFKYLNLEVWWQSKWLIGYDVSLDFHLKKV
jgi:hypothetical protein